MFKKTTDCVAMLLAGGQGSRLGVLTKDIAKPAVPFGGKYRIIDFPLSNCINSGIDTVGVLTQYQPLVLNDYIGSGQPWDLDRVNGGVHILPPYQRGGASDWYKGTANAIYQNTAFLERYNPKYVLVLSGDHIYKMNYAKMIKFHEENQADATIAVLEVEPEEASRFGIMNARPDGTIYEFEEKPANPKSNKASMGIYIFNWDTLRRYLAEDEKNPASTNDFGKDIIPAMLEGEQKLMAYSFIGYWKDVGTIESLWESNMDLLNPNIPIDLSDSAWRIYSRNPAAAPHFICAGARVQNSLITDGCDICGTVDFSVIFQEVKIGAGATVRDSIIMPGAIIGEKAVIEYSIIGEGVTVGDGAVIGSRPEESENLEDWGVAVVGPGLTISSGALVPARSMIESNLERGNA